VKLNEDEVHGASTECGGRNLGRVKEKRRTGHVGAAGARVGVRRALEGQN
jgi:hypothetical protein